MISEISFLDSLMVALILSIFSDAVSSRGGGGTKSSCQPPPLSSPPPSAPSATKFDKMGFRLTGDSFMFCYFDWTSNFSSIFFRCVERRRLRKFSRGEGGGSRRAQIISIRSPISSRRALWSPSYSGPCLFREPPEDGRQFLVIIFAGLKPLPRLHNLMMMVMMVVVMMVMMVVVMMVLTMYTYSEVGYPAGFQLWNHRWQSQQAVADVGNKTMMKILVILFWSQQRKDPLLFFQDPIHVI